MVSSPGTRPNTLVPSASVVRLGMRLVRTIERKTGYEATKCVRVRAHAALVTAHGIMAQKSKGKLAKALSCLTKASDKELDEVIAALSKADPEEDEAGPSPSQPLLYTQG